MERQMPYGAKCHGAPNAIRREVPDRGRAAAAVPADVPPNPAGALPAAVTRSSAFRAVWDFAPYGISRRSGFRAVWDSALHGISRFMAFRAVWHFAPDGISRRMAFRAVWHFAPYGISRRMALRASVVADPLP
jgi:hypothetical protein